MSGYLFILGNTPELAFAELSVCYPNVQKISPDVAYTSDLIDPNQAILRLGGVVKIAQVVTETDKIDSAAFVQIFQELPELRFTFGISSYTADVVITHTMLDTVKDELTTLGKHPRFVEAKHEGELSSVVITKQSLTELVVAKHNSHWFIGKTVAVQDFQEWGRRDFGRPFCDPKAGMLPPKVARMMVNLASDGFVIPAPEPGSSVRKEWIPGQARNDIKLVLLDPFCGMGTVLGEALLTGWKVLGSDLSSEVIGKAEKNLRWLEGSDTSNFTLMVADATQISQQIPPASVDAIVTEPFMGNTQMSSNNYHPISNDHIKNTIKGLEKLYIGCLKDWQTVLKSGGLVVITFPKYCMNGREFFVKKVIDRCENLGYTIRQGPIEYCRPLAVVKREIFIFQYGTH